MKIFSATTTRFGSKKILRWLWASWKGNHFQAILNALLGITEVVVSLLIVWAMQHAIDVAAGTIPGNIYCAVGLIGAFIMGNYAVRVSQVWVRNVLGVRAQNKMQQRLFDRLLRSEWQGKEQRHSGDVMNRLERDVTTIVEFLTETLPNTMSTLALFVGASAYMFAMDKMLAVILVVMIPFFVLFSRLYVGPMRRLTREVRNSDSEVQSVLQESVQNRMLIKTFEGDAAMVERLENTQSVLRKKVEKRTLFSLFSYLVLNLGFSLGYIIAFLWGALRLSAGTLSFGGMTAFLQLVARIQNPARQLIRLAPAFVGVFIAAERLMELEENPLEEQGEPQPLDAPCGIKLDAVTYKYADGDQPVLDNLSFDFRPSTCTAILGETGSGKTTLIRLLMALVKPQGGAVKIYSGKSENPNHEQVVSPLHRCNFVYVPQGNTLMSGTIRENLLLGDPDATEERMMRALRMSCAEFVERLPEKLDTLCTELGGGLSEGQCQRISIARALLRNRPVILFDEATSALDVDTERRLLKNILADSDKTIIFITHRLAVVDYCDQTLRLC